MQVILSRRKLQRIACRIKDKEIVVCMLKSGNRILERMIYEKLKRVGPWVLGRNHFQEKKVGRRFWWWYLTYFGFNRNQISQVSLILSAWVQFIGKEKEIEAAALSDAR